ncbi:unnamed protein product [Albugo candida]|uniref:Uncharacterized protein n=1 Tax=Albugo candida TaxID=65357 RepID=A0A024G519_9STRA|nr:unnamed protein product [Albugo candida]|eukprot:CCI41777.1 unnamed protein product [Albugo candida]
MIEFQSLALFVVCYSIVFFLIIEKKLSDFKSPKQTLFGQKRTWRNLYRYQITLRNENIDGELLGSIPRTINLCVHLRSKRFPIRSWTMILACSAFTSGPSKMMSSSLLASKDRSLRLRLVCSRRLLQHDQAFLELKCFDLRIAYGRRRYCTIRAHVHPKLRAINGLLLPFSYFLSDSIQFDQDLEHFNSSHTRLFAQSNKFSPYGMQRRLHFFAP